MKRVIDLLAPLGLLVIIGAQVWTRAGETLPGKPEYFWIAGVALVVLHLLLRAPAIVATIGRRQLRYGGNTFVLVAVVLAILAAVYWITYRNTKRWDLTKNQPDHLGRDFSLIALNSDSLARFNHARTGWALEGGHREVKCDACHATRYQVSPAARRAPPGANGRWTGLERSCTSCHEDIHRDRFRVECTECHDLRAWAPAAQFDHDRSEYPLTGRHATMKSEQCHGLRPAGMRPGPSLLDPAIPPLRFAECSSCHKDPHQGRLGLRCAECHVTAGFFERPAAGRFDHYARTRYPLEGRHVAVRSKCRDYGSRKHLSTLWGTRAKAKTPRLAHGTPSL